MEAWDLFLRNETYDSSSSDEEDKGEKEGSLTGVKNTVDNEVDTISESSCMHGNDLFYENSNNKTMPSKNQIHYEDPFNLYDILNRNKDAGELSKDDDLKFPPAKSG
ncbi:hypothetical protein Tco_0443099 [Tanacetum coccineum]